MRSILAIDPGPVRSAWLILDHGIPGPFAIEENAAVLERCRGDLFLLNIDRVAIEKVEGFGMAVGVEVFETVFWSGRFAEAVMAQGSARVTRIGRKAVKLHLCGTVKAKDPNIRQALIDRFGGEGGKESAIGRKASPGPLYGLSSDVWAALAVAVTHHDQEVGQDGSSV